MEPEETQLTVLPTPTYAAGGGYWQLDIKSRQSNVEDGAAYWPQLWAEMNQWSNQGLAGAQADGHLDGFMTSPEILGEIKENILYGGGLAPARPKFGPRTVTYVYYILRGSRADVEAAVRHHMKVWTAGPLAVEHHGMGWLSGGFVSAPPTVEWLTYNHEYGVKVTATVTYTNPFISSVDARHKSLTGRVLYEAINTEGDKGYDFPLFTDWEQTSSGVVHLVSRMNLDGVTAYPLIAVKRPAGQAENRVLAFSVSVLDNEREQSATYTVNTGSTYPLGIAILDTANPNIMYRSNDTTYVPTWVGAVPTADTLSQPSGLTTNYYIRPATGVANAVTSIEAALLVADSRI